MVIYDKLIDYVRRFKLQSAQYTERIPLAGVIPAGGTLPFKANVSNLGHFFCLFMTGRYETLYSVTVGAATKILDDGICHLRMAIEDGGTGQRLLFSDYAPMDLFLSPGRIRSRNAENNLLDVATFANKADNAPQLFNTTEFNYLFTANSDIICRVKNDSNTAISFDLLFYGIRRKTGSTAQGLKQQKQ
jgi:hypothetical protein